MIMPNPKRSKSKKDSDNYIVELTSGQRLIAIVIAILVVLIAFLLGVTVGRHHENSRKYDQARLETPNSDLRTPTTSKSAPGRDGTGTQITPRKDLIPKTSGSTSGTRPERIDDKSDKIKPPWKDIAAPSPNQLEPSEPDVPKSVDSDKTEKAEAPDKAPVVSPKTTDTPPVKAAATTSSGYSVQVGAFSILKNAEEMKEKIEKDSTISEKASIVKGRTLYFVRVGSCSDKSTAEKLRDKLKSKGFPEEGKGQIKT